MSKHNFPESISRFSFTVDSGGVVPACMRKALMAAGVGVQPGLTGAFSWSRADGGIGVRAVFERADGMSWRGSRFVATGAEGAGDDATAELEAVLLALETACTLGEGEDVLLLGGGAEAEAALSNASLPALASEAEQLTLLGQRTAQLRERAARLAASASLEAASQVSLQAAACPCPAAAHPAACPVVAHLEVSCRAASAQAAALWAASCAH